MREYYDLRDVKKTKATVYVLPQVSHFLREGDLIEIDIKGDLWLAVMLDSQRLILTRKL